MILTKNQKIITVISILAITGISYYIIFRKKVNNIIAPSPKNKGTEDSADDKTTVLTSASKTKQDKQVSVTTSNSSKRYYNSNGANKINPVSEAYKKVIGTSGYLRTSNDNTVKNSWSLIKKISQDYKIPMNTAELTYLRNMNRRIEGIDDAIKVIDNNIDRHTNHYLKTGEFLYK